MERIQHLQRKDIDTAKWDDCIRNAGNSLVYGYSFYLDAMAKKWDGLVLNDYEAVMPLTWNKKYGIYYLYQPPFTAALGVFGKKITAAKTEQFLNAIPASLKYWDFYLNHGNCFRLQQYNLYQRMNFVLDLNQSYDVLYSKFKTSTQRNIKKFAQLQGSIQKNIPVEDVVQLSKQQSAAFSNSTEKDFEQFVGLYRLLYQKQQAVTYGAFCNGQLMASAVFVFDEQRAYYILVGNHPNGKTIGASHALINAFINDHAPSNLLLDFEGSDIHSLAFFYSSFGAVEEKYCGIKMNNLPWPVRLLKK
ncbi:MAG: hypothetical protein JST86_05895 [Bacteroidetes bacterium]|nr:hypothetical protein [Bacteroidota bacterium]